MSRVSTTNGSAKACAYAALSSSSETANAQLSVCINDVLPKDLLLRIFSYLDLKTLCRCSQVSKYWNKLAFDGNIWKSIDLFEFQKDVKPIVVQKIAENCQGFLRHLRLRGCQDIKDETVGCFTKRCPLIEKLVLSECRHLTDATCEHIGQHCHHITALFLDSCALITDNGMNKLFDYLPKGSSSQLRGLDISWCNVGDEGLQAIAAACPQLQILRCLGCVNVTSAGVQAIAEHCSHLWVLNVNYCAEGISDDALVSLSQGCKQLHQLSMSGCSRITDTGVRALAAGCSQLHALEVSRCRNLTDNGFVTLARTCPLLKKLDLEECSLITDSTLIALATHCLYIDTLILSYCDQITNEGICRLAASPAGRECLRHLALDNCPNVTDQALDALGINCMQLSKLDIFDCQCITRTGLNRLHDRLSQLQMQAYFAPPTPPESVARERHRRCRCCVLL